MNRNSIRLSLALALPLASLSFAQGSAQIASKDDLDTLVAITHKDTLAHKADIVSKNMILDGAQAAAFWPLYKQYEAERQRVDAVRHHGRPGRPLWRAGRCPGPEPGREVLRQRGEAPGRGEEVQGRDAQGSARETGGPLLRWTGASTCSST